MQVNGDSIPVELEEFVEALRSFNFEEKALALAQTETRDNPRKNGGRKP